MWRPDDRPIAAAAGLLAFLVAAASAGAQTPGELIYRKQCASCHGPEGEGTDKHSEPLAGRRPLDKLAAYIEKNMPEDDPGKCVGDEARKVAEYIYHAFYSPSAQARKKPLRTDLARLTVAQYRNAVADVTATFREAPKPDDRKGLRGEYFNSGRRIQESKRAIDRIDPTVEFKFPAAGPGQGVKPEEYAVRWSGGVLAPDTGEYEFVVETENGARLWVNDADRPLIDVWVRSGTETRHRETTYLLGGRVYALRLEVFKAKGDKSASVALRWKRPHRVEELIPERLLTPGKFPEVLVLRTPFPPDDRSMGYERSTSISKAWDEATTHGALDVAAYVAARLDAFAGVKPGAADAAARVREFGHRFAERAFRRPLSADEKKIFVDRQIEGTDLDTAVKRVVLLALKSPRFLYHDLDPAANDAYDAACRISFGLWDSIPDAALLEAARSGRLNTPEGVTREIERMLPDLRTRAKMRAFYHQWLDFDRLQEISKDAKRYPEFTEAIVSDLRTSLDLFLDSATWGEGSDFRELLLSDAVFLNGRLARFYGVTLPADAAFQKVALGREKQAGLLTHPLLMAGLAYESTSSPIHRGIFIARSLLGKRLRPPQDAVTPLSPDLHPDLTTRERIALQTRPQACQSCHSMVNPLGFALEHYDAVGRFRDQEKGRPIDASGTYATLAGEAVQFKGARDLGEFLARSEETHAAFVEHLFHFFVKQPVRAYGHDRPELLRQEFVKSGFSIRKLLVHVIASSALKGRNP